MSISSEQKTWLLAGTLIIVAIVALVYFDPLGLNLLGPKPSPVKPAPPRVTAPAAKPPVAAPMATIATPHAAPVVAPAPLPPVAAMPASTKPAVAPIQAPQPPMESSKSTGTSGKPAIDKPMRSKNLDLRHCLELETDAAIAKCAGE